MMQTFQDIYSSKPGQQSWHFVLTNADPGGSTLTYKFDDGTQGSVGETKYTGGTYHFYVFTTAGAKLISASATNATSNSNLNVSHCESGDRWDVTGRRFISRTRPLLV